MNACHIFCPHCSPMMALVKHSHTLYVITKKHNQTYTQFGIASFLCLPHNMHCRAREISKAWYMYYGMVEEQTDTLFTVNTFIYWYYLISKFTLTDFTSRYFTLLLHLDAHSLTVFFKCKYLWNKSFLSAFTTATAQSWAAFHKVVWQVFPILSKHSWGPSPLSQTGVVKCSHGHFTSTKSSQKYTRKKIYLLLCTLCNYGKNWQTLTVVIIKTAEHDWYTYM